MRKRSAYSRASDVMELYLTPTDVKQFVFCPRVTFFNRVMRLKAIMDSQQEDARDAHGRIERLEARREKVLKHEFPFAISEKLFDLSLVSTNMRVQGRVDMLLISTTGEYIPVEFKVMKSQRGHVLLDHKYQVVVLALLIEEIYDKIVRRAIVYYMLDDKIVLMPISDSMKARGKNYLHRIWKMIESEEMPPPRRNCSRVRVGCGFSDKCTDF